MSDSTNKTTPADVLAAATDEFAFASAVATAGFPGRLPQSVIEAARKYVNSPRLGAAAAEDELAKAAASTAGATGLASHDRNRVAVLFTEEADVVKAAAAAAGPRANTARTLVWFLVGIDSAEKEAAAPVVTETPKPRSRASGE